MIAQEVVEANVRCSGKFSVDSFSSQGIVFLGSATLIILHKKLHKTSYPQHLLKLHLYLNKRPPPQDC